MPLNSEEFERLVANVDVSKMEEILVQVKSRVSELKNNKDEIKSLIGYIDLTTLAGDDTKKRVEALVDRALLPLPSDPTVRCGAVCVYPAQVKNARDHLNRAVKSLKVASVAAGFPSGQYHLKSRLLEIELTVADGAAEIDVVINRCAALEGEWNVVYDELVEMKKKCLSATMKSILATGELKSVDNIVRASAVAVLAGSDFIKTSTGKESVNATFEVACVMCLVIKQFYKDTGIRIGFKPAGGIRTVDEALGFRAIVEIILGKEWLTPVFFRIGASSLLDNIIAGLQ